ncbi:MAG: DUF3048 domain-containing protein [Lachnospiraceae bacterium]|nr:DUF3048 domain-containing protein [Lachnospiraceae bacterium]MDY5640923.1 DUF3048 domain-containing protein [Lachnospiraceae bacterium]
MIIKSKAKALVSVLLSSAMILSLVGCKSNEEPVAEKPAVEVKTEEPASSSSETIEETTDPNALAPGMMRSFLSGLPVDEKIGNRRPVAIMLNNLEAAQPMSGVSKADVVYEYVVEGSITRLMGLFENYDDLDKIGSVRSCREYFVYTALEFDAIYMHFGQAAYALSLLEEDYVDNLNGLGEAGDTCFYRTTDRKAPHNVYTSAKGIEAGIKKLGYRENHYEGYKGKFKFCDLDKEVTNEGGMEVTHMEPKYRINKPWFEYNPETKKYDRFQYDGPQIDAETGEQLSYDNVIFQYNFWTQLDEKDYLAFDCHSGGSFQYFTHGKMVMGTWQREINEDNYNMSAIRYYDQNGDELVINNGKTFVCVIQNTEVENVVLK